jgi:hypothetical protein
MTLYSSIFTSRSRVRFAHDSDVHSLGEQYFVEQYLAGVHAGQETLVTAHELGVIQFNHHVLTGAARSGDLTKLMWLYTEQHCELDRDEDISIFAAMSGSIAVLEWLKQQGVTLTGYASNLAAQYGHMHVLQYLHAEGCEKGRSVCYAAADNGDLEMLKWARKHDYPWDQHGPNNVVFVCGAAAGSYNIELMAWLIQQPGVQLSAGLMAAAAGVGDITMCEFLLANQCPWSEHTCLHAANRGEVDMLRWLREHGCPCNTVEVADVAASLYRVAVLEYLQQEAVVFTAEQLTQMLNVAGIHGSLATAQWLRQQGAQWPAVLRSDLYHNWKWKGKTLAWARAEGCISPLG